jgi:hypothetical protein
VKFYRTLAVDKVLAEQTRRRRHRGHLATDELRAFGRLSQVALFDKVHMTRAFSLSTARPNPL